MLIDHLGAFALTALLIELTPGPNMAYLAVLSASYGRLAGLAATFGVALGLLGVGLAAAFGLAALISQSWLLYEVLRWAGVAYLLWLAWSSWREAEAGSGGDLSGNGLLKAAFTRGLVTNLLNPKAALFYIAVLPAFVDPTRAVLTQTVALSLVYVAVATAIHTSIVVLAASAQPLLSDPARSQAVRRALAVALAVIVVWFAYSTAR